MQTARLQPALFTVFVAFGCGGTDLDSDGESVDTFEEGISIASGWDYSVPAGVKPEHYSGFWAGDGPNGGHIRHQGITMSWAELNPSKGQYNWSKIQNALNAATSGDYLVVFRLMNLNVHEDGKFGEHGTKVPQWVLDGCKASGSPVRLLELRKPDYPTETIQAAAPWNACLKGHYKTFIQAFGAKGLQNDTHFGGMYVTGLSTSFGEEMVVSNQSAISAMKSGANPITHAKMQSAFIDRIDWWAAAFGTERYKLAWVGSDNWGEFGPDCDAIGDHAVDAGVGRREGWLETAFNKAIGDQDFAQLGLDAHGDYQTDESLPWVQGDKPYYFGEEIESWNANKNPNEAYSFRVATLRALQMRMRYLWSNQSGVALDPKVTDYFNVVAGKTATESPDAWVYLRETRARLGQCTKTRNFDRWLRQDETAATGSVTRRGTKVVRRHLPYDCSTEGEGTVNRDWEGRLTDKSNGNPRMRFIIDRDFLPQGVAEPMTLKITFRDRGNAFTVSYCSGGQTKTTAAIQGTGSVANAPWKTASVALGAVESARCMNGVHDLGLNATSGDLEAAFVRLVR